MLKRFLIVAGLVALFLPTAGCNTTEPVMWSWPHHKRRLNSIANGFHKLHMTFDRVIFDMDDRPIESDF